MVTGAAMLVGTVGGGLLGSLDLSLPYLVRAGMLLAVFAVALATMRDLGFRPRTLRWAELPGAMSRVARDSVTFGWNRRSLRLLMICSFLQWGFLTWGWYAWQPYFLALLGRDAVWIAGVLAALISLSTIAGNALVDRISRHCGRRTTLMLWAAAVQAVAAIGVGLAGEFGLAVALFLLVTLATGVMGPVKQAYVHEVTPSAHRASVVSFDSMVGNAGGVLGQSGLGYLARVRSIASGYVSGGVALLFALPVLLLLRRLGERADRFTGEGAGTRSTCAAQGIPEISQVDAHPAQERGMS
jgi:predicted MFS family arabinose efflux permease